jgi:peptidoglycan/LPS O-acetylase OafA/YrhL
MLQLDSLRAIAVLAVLMHHAGVRLGVPGPLDKFDSGHLGVSLFFVLSGYLISGILLADRDQVEAGAALRAVITRFYFRRFLRIVPVYYATLLVLLAIDFEETRELWLWLSSYSINLRTAWRAEWPGHLSHFWSLAVEQQFYLIWPLLVLTIRRPWHVTAMWVAVALGPLTRALVVLFLASDLRDGGYTSVALPVASFDSLGAGSLLAWYVRSRPTSLVQWALTHRALPLGVCATLILLIVDESIGSGSTWFIFGDVAVALVFVWLVGVTSARVPGALGRILEWPVLVWLGNISYGIYVFHLPILKLLLDASARTRFDIAQHGALARLVACTLPSVALAAASFYWFERPIRALGTAGRRTRYADISLLR